MRQRWFSLVMFCVFLAAVSACVHDANYIECERVPIYGDSGLYQPDYTRAQESQPTFAEGVEQPPAESPQESQQTSRATSSGKIVIITGSRWGVNEQYVAAAGLAAKHSTDKIIHINAPELFERNGLQYAASIAEKITQDSEVSVLIINPAGNIADHLVHLVREQRSDIFVVYIEDRYREVYDASMVDLILGVNMLEMNAAFLVQAQKLGAETIVFFAPNDCWSNCCEGRNTMRMISEALNLNFVEVFDYDEYVQCGSSLAAYMAENMFMLIEKYGQNIAFTGLCDERLLWSFPHRGTIYPTSLMIPPSPPFIAQGLFVPSLREIELEDFYDKNNIAFIIAETRNFLAEQNLLGRISAWPVSANTMLTYAAVEYSIMWMNGEVSQNDIDLSGLQRIMADFIAAHSEEEGLGITLTRHSQNHILIFMDFMTY